jgi:hypothetical protein
MNKIITFREFVFEDTIYKLKEKLKNISDPEMYDIILRDIKRLQSQKLSKK